MKTRATKQSEQPKRENPDGLLFRTAHLDVRADEGADTKTVRMSVSSETPVLTYAFFNERYQRVWEILDHGEGSVDMSRCAEGLVILDRHYGDQVGIMDASLADRKLGGPIRFGSGARSQEISKDAAAGIRRNCSVGYRVAEGAYRLEGDKDGIPVVRAMSWMPYEASFEPVPADTTVGVGRADHTTQQQTAQRATVEKTTERTDMNPKEMAELFARAAKFGIAADKVQPLLDKPESARAELDAMIVEKQGGDIEALRKERDALANKKPDAPANVRTVEPIGGSMEQERKVLRRYSVMNVCRALGGDHVDIGFEREVSQECARLRGKEAKGIIIPFGALAKRDFTVSGTSSATVATNLYPDQFIELLKDRYIIGKLGCVFMPGVVGNIAIPKMSAGTTCYHVSEGGDITESQPTLGQVTGTPHTIGALVDITRRMIEQSTPGAEDLVRMEIMDRVMLGVQTDVFAGTGSDGQPTAITGAEGINNPSVTQGTPTYAEILNFLGDIEADNASGENMQWAMTSEVWVKLASTMRTATYGDIPVLDPEKPTMLGHTWHKSEGLPANSLWFGNWATVVIPMWGSGIEVASDTAKLFASGGVTLRALLDFDVMVRQGKALAYNTAVTS